MYASILQTQLVHKRKIERKERGGSERDQREESEREEEEECERQERDLLWTTQ